MIRQQWSVPLREGGNPLKAIAVSFEKGAEALQSMPRHHGCPLNNLAQEMSSLDAGFKKRIQAVFDEWIEAFRIALDAGKKAGVVREGVDSGDAALCLVTLIEGILSLAKLTQDPEVLRSGARNIRTFLGTLAAKGGA